MLEFCPVCKSLLQIVIHNNKPIGECKCGFKRTSGISIEAQEDNQTQNSQKQILISQESNQDSSECPDFTCDKCGHKFAQVTELGEILSNEKSVTIFKCLNCGFSERQ